MKRFVLLLVCAIAISSIGCVRTFDLPEFAEIAHHETGYLIPLEGANKDGQAQFDSEDFLNENKVAIKRIQIPHRWVQQGRYLLGFGARNGIYIDTVRLVVVDRSPVTRQWTAEEGSGTGRQDEAVWIESRDSIGFSLGFNCTAFVDEPDSSRFLYMYPTTKADNTQEAVDKSVASLSTVMDTEIRARVQQVAAEIAAMHDLDDLRGKKQDIIDSVRADVVPFFKNRGITITTLGMFGGFAYEEPKIQAAIDETFIAQQEKVRTEAAFEAQQRKNDTIELAANAAAEKVRRVAQGKADAEITLAEAEATAIRNVAAATKEAGKDPLFLELKKLEVEAQRITKWDGAFPRSLMNLGGGSAPNLLLNVPIGATK